MNGVQIKRVSFIAPSTCLPRCEKSRVNQTISRLKKILGEVEVELSPHLFSSDELIDHVTAPLEDRAENFKQAIRNSDLIISVAGGTGAEDILFKIDKKDYQVMRERKPIFIGFSDFTFLLSDIYYNSRIPVIYFPTLRLGQGNFKKIAALAQTQGQEPTEKDLAQKMSLPDEKILEMLTFSQEEISLETPINESGDSFLGDFIEDSSASDPTDSYIHLSLRENLKKAFDLLTDREKAILTMRYGLDDGHEYTLEEIGRHFKLTRERIRQIELRALKKIRQSEVGQILQTFQAS